MARSRWRGINGGEPPRSGPSFRDVGLVPGTHRFKFVGAHDCCIDEEITLKIPPGDGLFTVASASGLPGSTW